MNIKLLIITLFSTVLVVFELCGQKTINLDFGFKVTAGQVNDFGDLKTYNFFELSKDGKKLFIDSISNEYEFGNNLYPLVLKTGINSYELLFEVNDRPNKNYLKRFFVKNDSLVKVDILPTFIAEYKDVDNDGIKEYAGFWDYAEVWGVIVDSIAYKPMNYYEVTENGIKLDSSLTIEKNKMIYGEFCGFKFSEKCIQSTSSLGRFNEEIDELKE